MSAPKRPFKNDKSISDGAALVIIFLVCVAILFGELLLMSQVHKQNSHSSLKETPAQTLDCSCNPACSSSQYCCPTANGQCGCFPFNCP